MKLSDQDRKIAEAVDKAFTNFRGDYEDEVYKAVAKWFNIKNPYYVKDVYQDWLTEDGVWIVEI